MLHQTADSAPPSTCNDQTQSKERWKKLPAQSPKTYICSCVLWRNYSPRQDTLVTTLRTDNPSIVSAVRFRVMICEPCAFAGLLEWRFREWREGRLDALVRMWRRDRVRAVERRQVRRAAGRRPEREREERLAYVLQLIAEGELSRAMRILHSLGMAELTPGVLAQMQRKHPSREWPMPAACPVGRRVTVEMTEVFRTLRRRAGTGPSGRRNEYLQALTVATEDRRARSVMPLVDEFYSSIVSHEMPDWFYHAWGASRLTPLVKRAAAEEGGDPDARPVEMGEVDRRACERALTQRLARVFEDALAPQQVAVGVSGGLSIMVHGLRLLLEQRGDFVCVRIDFSNAYNEVDRRRAFERIARQPRFADIVPLLHALYAQEGLIITGDGERLFGGERAGDSSTGFGQGAPLSSAAFCIAIQEFVEELDAALRPSGGCARFDMDDGYAVGPAEVVFQAVERFAQRVEEHLGLTMQPTKSRCFSRAHDLEACGHRRCAGVPVGQLEMADIEDPEAAHTLVRGILVAGVPFYDEADATALLRAHDDRAISLRSYYFRTAAELQSESQSLWASLQYALAPTFDYWVQHDFPTRTARAARHLDTGLLDVARVAMGARERLCYTRQQADPFIDRVVRRLRMPARERGGGLRSREALGPIAFAASFIGAAERFIDRTVDGGGREEGFFPMLTPLFGDGAFDTGGHRFGRFVAAAARDDPAVAAAFTDAWRECQDRAGVGADPDRPVLTGPLAHDVADAGRDRVRSKCYLHDTRTYTVVAGHVVTSCAQSGTSRPSAWPRLSTATGPRLSMGASHAAVYGLADAEHVTPCCAAQARGLSSVAVHARSPTYRTPTQTPHAALSAARVASCCC